MHMYTKDIVKPPKKELQCCVNIYGSRLVSRVVIFFLEKTKNFLVKTKIFPVKTKNYLVKNEHFIVKTKFFFVKTKIFIVKTKLICR